MDRDMHYYGIGFLARAAGFTKGHALTIAYASQYVDHATEGEPIRVGDTFFDPVRTAHFGLKSFSWGVQKKIFIPFHFIPPRPFDSSPGAFNFVTERYSPFAVMVFRQACRKSADETSRLIGIGIALHTLADSWAHQGFSGRQDPINNVETIEHFKDNDWEKLFLENIVLDFLPEVGHAEAGFFPEHPYLHWRYIRKATGKSVDRNNLEEYLHAAETLHKLLSAVRKSESAPVLPWKEIKPKIQVILESPEPNAAKRCEKWIGLYCDVFGETSGYHFDELEWRDEALNPADEEQVRWDDFKQTEFARLAFDMSPNFYETPWVKFHRAALRHRNLVLENLL